MAVTALLSRSLKFRMTCVVTLLVLGATMIVASLALGLAERGMKSIIGSQQHALLAASAAHIDDQLAARKILMASLADTMPAGAADQPAAIAAFIAQHPTVRREFLNLVAFDRRGKLVFSTTAATTLLDVSARDYFIDTVQGKQGVISAPFRSRVSSVPVVLITQPVLDAGGAVALVLGGSIDLEHAPFMRQLDDHKPGQTGFLFIMTRQGMLLHHPDQDRLLQHVSERPGRNAATDMALAGFEGWTEAVNKDGSRGIYAYQRMHGTDWIMGARFPVAEAFAPLDAMRRRAMLVAGAFALVAGVVAWLAIAGLLKPLERLRGRLHAISSGGAGIGVLLRRRQDEIGELSNALHRLMAERETAQERTRASEQRARLMADNLPALIAYFDSGQRFHFLNATFRQWFGLEPDSLTGRHVQDAMGWRHYRDALPHIEQALRGQRASYETTADIAGSRHTMQTMMVPDIGADGSVAGVYSLTHDTTRMKEIEQRLIQLARIDTLTGIANRLMFDEILQLAMARARRSEKPMALAYLDIDHFKNINDTLGHGAGDAVLRAFAACLVGSVRATDTVARLAGDEFVIVFEQVTPPDEVTRLAAKIGAAVRNGMDAPGDAGTRSGPRVTTSIGVVLYQRGGYDETPAELLARADRALYCAKRNGRDGFALA